MIKSRRIRWGERGHLARRKEKRSKYILFVRNTKERLDLGDEGVYGKVKLKLICGKWAGGPWTELTRLGKR
jgi:hypothetical protein